MKERVKYIDVAKGLLIICVVLGHIASIGKEFGSINNNYFDYIGYLLSIFYVPFYMQAFFFITGYTSNFNKPFNQFLLHNTKRLLIPFISFSVIYAAFNKLLFSRDFWFTTMDGEKLFFLVESYWFLSTMFLAKLLFWGLYRLRSNLMIIFLCLVLFWIAATICSFYQESTGSSHWHNWFHYRNALMMVIFIGLGFLLKSIPNDLVHRYGAIAYLLVFILSLVLGFYIPCNGHSALSIINHIPLHLLCATTGSLMVLYVSKKLFSKGSFFLETFGRHSLTVYVVHYLILEIIIML